jgi:hypothetical protein
MMRIALLCLFASLLLAPAKGAHAQRGCVEAAIEPGQSETFIFGISPPDDFVCYRLATTRGQRLSIKVVNGRNIMFGVEGIQDGVDELTFTAQRTVYEVRVVQLMRSITREPFRIRVSLAADAGRAQPAPKAGPEAGRDPPPTGGERTKRTGEIASYVPAVERAAAERALDILRRGDFNALLAECAKEFRWSLKSGGDLKLNLNPQTMVLVDRERLHIMVQGMPTLGAAFTVYTLVRARGAGGAYTSVCMPCLGSLQNGRIQYGMPNMEEALPAGQPCPGGSALPNEPARPAPSAPQPREDENASDAAIQRAKVARFVNRDMAAANLSAPRDLKTELEFVDLDGDGVDEALLILRSQQTCGSRGCTAYVLDLHRAEARNIGDFTAEVLKALPTRTNGWRDLSLNGQRMTFRNGRYRSAARR